MSEKHFYKAKNMVILLCSEKINQHLKFIFYNSVLYDLYHYNQECNWADGPPVSGNYKSIQYQLKSVLFTENILPMHVLPFSKKGGKGNQLN